METKEKILEYRKRLDKTLASRKLLDKECVKTLVKNQLLHSSPSETPESIDNFLERRTLEVTNLLDMLRSVSRNNSEISQDKETAHGDWKLKQECDDYRVMYRQGAQGTPFHTLLVEGYIEGPADVCLCLSWDAALYKKWWPESRIPPFKIIAANCVQKVRIGEQICVVRMKVAWPLSAREVVMHYFVFEYFEEDLIIVLFNTISDLDNVDKCTHGFTNDGIPEAEDIVRMDVVGGFAVQKVTSSKSYFRNIATMDAKVDFIPPSLINIVSRQLIGSGFKLFQKAVTSATGDDDFKRALKDPLYAKVRECLNRKKDFKKNLELESIEINESGSSSANELKSESQSGYDPVLNHISHDNILEEGLQRHKVDQQAIGDSDQTFGQTAHHEIEEEENSETYLKVSDEVITKSSTKVNAEYRDVYKEHKAGINPEVENALSILDKAIAMVRGGVFNIETWPAFGSRKHGLWSIETVSTDLASASVDRSNSGVRLTAPKMENMDRIMNKVEKSSEFVDASSLEQTTRDEGAASSMKQDSATFIKFKTDSFSFTPNGTVNEATLPENVTKDRKDVSHETNGVKKKQKRKRRLCCSQLFSTIS